MKSVFYIIIIVLLAIIFFQRECITTSDSDRIENVEVIYDTIHDTVEVAIVNYVPKISYIDTGNTIWRYHTVDTALILLNYFSKNYYQDTILVDSVCFIVLKDTITQNKITFRHPWISYYPRLIKKTTIINKDDHSGPSLFLGLGLGRNMKQFSLSPSLMFISRKQTAYSLSYDLLNQDVYFTMYWKIQLRK